MENKNHSAEPLVTVVTVCYNCADVIEKTIQSVITQTDKDIEYLIIDGGSTDGTVDIIRKYQDHITKWVSEKDKGIYDAMNKGIAAATGRWINFMNAGDYFYANDMVEKMRPALETASTDLLYGDCEIRYANFSTIQKAKPLTQLWKKTVFSHQSLFTRTMLLKQRPFDTQYKIGADFDFTYFAYLNKYTFVHTDIVVSSYAVGGISDTKGVQTVKEFWSILKKYRQTNLKVNIYYSFLILKPLIKKILPDSLKRFIITVMNAK